jgi:hydroxyacylglutathione hydrolase
MEIKTFIFNPFQVNTYLLYDQTNECVIIDSACHGENESAYITRFIDSNHLNPKALLNTHAHVDHICGNKYLMEHYGLPLYMHEKDEFLVETAVKHGLFFGFEIQQPPYPTGFLTVGEKFSFGQSSLDIIHAPGHSPGSVLFYSEVEKFLVTGDVIFAGSIGRTDLPRGSFSTLIESIKSGILTLPGDTKIFPGHGDPTTVRKEKESNPFLQSGY